MSKRALSQVQGEQPTVVIHEIYRSVQGETSFVGRPCTFVRLSACNLRCRWCDTPQAFEGGTRRAVDDVVSEALGLGTQMVLVTGGEPLLQAGAHPLMTALCDAGKLVLLETSGERSIDKVDPRVRRIMDLKAPGSGESTRNRWDNIALLGPRDQVKIVLADRADYDWARGVIAKHQLDERVAEVLLSPVHGQLDPRLLVDWMLADGVSARLQLQMHKVIWGQHAEGV